MIHDAETRREKNRASLVELLKQTDRVALVAQASLSYQSQDRDTPASENDRLHVHIEYLALQAAALDLRRPVPGRLTMQRSLTTPILPLNSYGRSSTTALACCTSKICTVFLLLMSPRRSLRATNTVRGYIPSRYEIARILSITKGSSTVASIRSMRNADHCWGLWLGMRHDSAGLCSIY